MNILVFWRWTVRESGAGCFLVGLGVVAALALPATAGGVRIVSPSGSLDFAGIQEAVDASQDGDVLLVGAGSYAPFTITGTSLSILAAPDATVVVAGTIEVRDLPPTGVVLLHGLSVTGATLAAHSAPGMLIRNCAGHVRLQDCELTGGWGSGSGCTPYGAGGPGLVVEASNQVLVVGCSLSGGAGAFETGQLCCCWGGAGGHGLENHDSVVALYDCTLRGGKGGAAGTKGGHGGSAAYVEQGGLFAAGCSFTGGKGGDSEDLFAIQAGDGGHGLELLGHQAHLVDNVFVGGQGGHDFGSFGAHGAAGLGLFVLGGVAIQHPGIHRTFVASPLHADSTAQGTPDLAHLEVQGQPGDSVWLLVSDRPAFEALAGGLGLRTVGKPGKITQLPLGTIPAGGQLSLDVPVGAVPKGSFAGVRFVQGWVVDAQGGSAVGTPLHWVVLDRGSAPDCDSNGSNDYVDALEGVSIDCNTNLIADTCEIASGTSPDCNANGVPDACDIANGTTPDFNGNGVPDICEATLTTWYVDASAPTGGTGSQGAPFQTIAEAVAASFSYDTVLLLDGVYKGPGNKDLSLDGKSIVIRSLNGPANCIVDCEYSGRAFYIHPGVTYPARIEGLTIRAGDTWPLLAGGIVVDNAAVTLSNCVFEDCRGAWTGGLMAVGADGTVIEDCEFLANSNGGAFVSGEVVVRRCLFQGNMGPGLRLHGGVANTVSHSRFFHNSASGLVAEGPSLGSGSLVEHCLFAGNTSVRGGGIECDNQAASFGPNPVRVNHCTLVGNSASEGGGLHVTGASQCTIENSILWGNSAPSGANLAVSARFSSLLSDLSVSASDVGGGQAGVLVGLGSLAWGPGNLDLDPLFVDLAGPDGDPLTVGDNDYRLAAGSPCVDAGNNPLVAPDSADIDGDGDLLEPIPLDLDGLPRFVDDPGVPDTGIGPPPIVDLGAWERP